MMDHPKLYFYIWNLIINSTLAFYTLRLLLAFFLRCHPFSSRVKVLWSSLLFMHLLLHPFTYTWSLWGETSPWEAEVETRELFMTLFCPLTCSDHLMDYLPTTQLGMRYLDGRTFTPADCLSNLLPFAWIQFLVLLAGVGALFFFTRFLYALFCERRLFAKLIEESPLAQEKLTCIPFANALKAKKIEIRLSQALPIPCAYGIAYGISQSCIFMPSSLHSCLTQEERQAILMHEWGHLHYRDTALLLLCQAISCLFWWIPMRSALKRLAAWQEETCDDAVRVWNQDPHDLALALCQVARFNQGHQSPQKTLTHQNSYLSRALHTSSSAIEHRIKRLTQELPATQHTSSRSRSRSRSRFYRLLHALRYVLLTLMMLSTVCGKFWSF